MTDTTNVRDTIEVGSVVLLGSQRIRATVTYISKINGVVDSFNVRIDSLTTGGAWVRNADVVEVIKPPKPMPEFQEGDRVRLWGNDVLYRVSHFQGPYKAHMLDSMIEIWRLTAPDTLTKIWECKP